MKNEARGPLDISPSHSLRICAEQKYDYQSADTSAKNLCHVMRLAREMGERHRGHRQGPCVYFEV